MGMGTISVYQKPLTASCRDVGPLIPMRSFWEGYSALAASIRAHIKHCTSCRAIAKRIDPDAPVPQLCQTARLMAAGYFGRPLQFEDQIFFDAHVLSCPGCFDLMPNVRLTILVARGVEQFSL